MKLLPRGYFEFEDSKSQTIKGRVCTWSLNRFCEKMEIANVTEMFTAITTGVSIRAIGEMLLCAAEYMDKGKEQKYTIDDALDWVDDIGGLDEAVKLIESSMIVKDDTEKKSEEKTNP